MIAVILGVAVAQNQKYQNYQNQDQQGKNQYQEDDRNLDRRPISSTPIPIIHWNKEQDHDGTYRTK